MSVLSLDLESDVESAVVAWWQFRGLMTTKLNGEGQRGKPDRVFWAPKGKAIIIEFKRHGEEPTRLQKFYLDAFKTNGYTVAWFDNANAAIQFLLSHL